jgi:HSP20 family molecular chaperone IbpA
LTVDLQTTLSMMKPLLVSTFDHHHLSLMMMMLLMLLAVCLLTLEDGVVVDGWCFGLLHRHSNSMSSPLQTGWILPTPSKIQKKRKFTMDHRNLPTNSPSRSSSSSSGLASPSPPPLLYEITDNDQEFQIAMDVPGVKREDINVDLLLDDNGAHVLSISGLRLHRQADKHVKFSQTFALDAAMVAVDKLTANLENGVLIVSAPKDMMMKGKSEKTIRQQIPIRVPADKGDDDSHAVGGGGAYFDARNESNCKQAQAADPMKEEEEDLNAA